MKVAIGISGASGAIYGVRLLEELKKLGVETHLVISKWGEYTIAYETGRTVEEVRALASFSYEEGDMAAKISSGSFPLDAMVIAPCSMKTLAGIANGFSDELIIRAADVCLKEQRKLILLARETPLSAIHLENMLKVARAGALVMPPVPSFYNRPASIDEMVNHTIGRVLDQLGLDSPLVKRWDS
ncbi:MAG: UbiX family flavin prenyltransferase [Firmicutes bacterium]|nr:UbiX family flavin prenyltransferase [Bacillota bacterium]